MTRNTALSVVILAAIAGYFAAIWPNRPAGRAGQEGQTPQPTQVVQVSPPLAGEPGCGGRITWAARSGGEIRLAYQGQAATVWVAWPGGGAQALVADACTGQECRLSLPRPGITAVQVGLDDCEALELP